MHSRKSRDGTTTSSRDWSITSDIDRLIKANEVLEYKIYKSDLKKLASRVKVEYDKSPFAQHEGKTGILIDDFEKNTIAFENSGGIAILYHGNPTVAIKKLKEFGF